MTALLRTETRLLLREPFVLAIGAALPIALTLVIGFGIPSSRTPSPDLGGFALVQLYLPVTLLLTLCTIGVSLLPVALAGARATGVLRRLQTTPVRPIRLLLVHLLLHAALALVGMGGAVILATTAVGVSGPAQPLRVVAATLLACAALFSLGLVIAAIAPNGNAATGIGMAIYFPLLFLGGVWVPRPLMPDGLRIASDLSPSGAGTQLLAQAWTGDPAGLGPWVVLAVWTLVATTAAARFFRWT